MYLAHISKDRLREQSLKGHLLGTAELAGELAGKFGCMEWGYGCGLVHDIGKYSDAFQRRLHDGKRVDHASAGAQELFYRGKGKNGKDIMAAYCICGHHSGLPDGGNAACAGGEDSAFTARMKKQIEDYKAFQTEIELPSFPNPAIRPLGEGGFSLSFFIRMVFSCLVDADFLDTEEFMSNGTVQRGGYDPIEVLEQRLQKHVKTWLRNEDQSTVNGRRTAILKACIEKGKGPQGWYQLTVPTGGGKTIASLAFALEHARTHGLDRVIYVIPYTSIIEQNAQILSKILGEENVLEDHSNVIYDDPEGFDSKQLAVENWDKPVVVTTNVQFFESLFANKTSKCRKLHSIANSVVIFDEAQMLPAAYLKPCVRAISELVYNYHSTAVICTATQPVLEQFLPEQIQPRELCPDMAAQFAFFKRTEISGLGEISEEDLIKRLKEEKQVLCILNSRRRVQKVYEALESEGTFHLSTLMYPKHRKKLLQKIRDRLTAGLPCRLIATSLVEAGVDLDFPVVFRELAGIDSVIQTAGRCNREGRRQREESMSFVFTLSDAKDYPVPPELKLPVAVAGQISEKYEDLSSPDAVSEYFRRLYRYRSEGTDAKHIVEQMEEGRRSLSFPFASVAKQFRLIENDTRTILITKEEEAQQLLKRLRYGERSRKLLRQVGQYCVNVYENDFEKLNGAGLLESLDEALFLLRKPEQYSEEKGLMLNVERGDALFG